LPADQVTAEDEEEIDPDPPETVSIAGKREPHNAGVEDDHNDDGERAEKIETGLAFAVLKARIDYGLIHSFIDARNVADRRETRR
jgi:hypothetical protein